MAVADEIDMQIIGILKENSRTSYREIREQLGISIGTIHNRITKLKEKEIIDGYTIRLNPGLLFKPIDFIIYIVDQFEELEEKKKK